MSPSKNKMLIKVKITIKLNIPFNRQKSHLAIFINQIFPIINNQVASFHKVRQNLYNLSNLIYNNKFRVTLFNNKCLPNKVQCNRVRFIHPKQIIILLNRMLLNKYQNKINSLSKLNKTNTFIKHNNPNQI